MLLGGTMGLGGGGAGPWRTRGWAQEERCVGPPGASKGRGHMGQAGAQSCAAWLWGCGQDRGVVPTHPAPPSSQATWPPPGLHTVTLQGSPFPSLRMRKIGGSLTLPSPPVKLPLWHLEPNPLSSPSAIYRPPGLWQAPVLCAVGARRGTR